MLFYPKPAAEAASADLGRRREPGRAAPRHQVRRRLVSRQQQPDQAARYAPRLAAGIADVKRMCEAAKRDPASLGVSAAGAGRLRVGRSTRPRTARRGACSRAPRPTWPPMPPRCRRLGVGHVALRLGGATARGLRGAHRAVRRRGDRQDQALSRARATCARSPCAWQSSAADRRGSTSPRCGSAGTATTRCGSSSRTPPMRPGASASCSPTRRWSSCATTTPRPSRRSRRTCRPGATSPSCIAGERVAIDGVGFSAIGRLQLLQLLQRRAREAGVVLRFGHAVQSHGRAGGLQT